MANPGNPNQVSVQSMDMRLQSLKLLYIQIVGFGSQSMEFKELTKRDAERSLAIELEKLKKTGNLPELQAQMIDKEFGGFQRLFNKFLAADSGSAIEWERIEKLPSDAVSTGCPNKFWILT